MAATSSEIHERTLVAVAEALQAVKLEAIVIGNAASMLNGAPVTTQDIDLLIRDTPSNRRKLIRFAGEIGGSSPKPVSELRNVEQIRGRLPVPVEIHFDRIAGGLTFARVRTRSQSIDVGGVKLTVASLVDVIRSKEAADRPKDRAVLPILRDTLAVKKKLGAARQAIARICRSTLPSFFIALAPHAAPPRPSTPREAQEPANETATLPLPHLHIARR